jgi:hypothetical protein
MAFAATAQTDALVAGDHHLTDLTHNTLIADTRLVVRRRSHLYSCV